MPGPYGDGGNDRSLASARRRWFEKIYQSCGGLRDEPGDPVSLLQGYPDVRDREVVGLIVSGLAYGRVRQILNSANRVLAVLGPAPAQMVAESPERLLGELGAWRHRFTTAGELARLVAALGRLIRTEGSVEAVVQKGMGGDEPAVQGLSHLVGRLRSCGAGEPNSLLASPRDRSACKRLFLYCKWMVRRDHVDPGGWGCLSPSQLLLPMDTHMHRICCRLGCTTRKTPDLRAAVEATEWFRGVNPEDPTKYDFALTRYGIAPDRTPESLYAWYQGCMQAAGAGM
ncbi:MAG: TIGR02757 family protein [Synergistales bacterium]|nr:TIGR02757 family protein [Synergistales bacterium]